MTGDGSVEVTPSPTADVDAVTAAVGAVDVTASPSVEVGAVARAVGAVETTVAPMSATAGAIVTTSVGGIQVLESPTGEVSIVAIPGAPGTPARKARKDRPGADGGSYVHHQGVAADLWTIEHNLGWVPNMTIIDSAGSTIEGDIIEIDSMTLVVWFSAAFVGVAYLS